MENAEKLLEQYYEKDANMERDKRFVQRKSKDKKAIAEPGKHKKDAKAQKEKLK